MVFYYYRWFSLCLFNMYVAHVVDNLTQEIHRNAYIVKYGRSSRMYKYKNKIKK